MVNFLNELYIKALPSDDIRALPTVYMYVTGSLVLAVSCLAFLYFFYQGFIASTTQKFLSLSSDAGICNVVVKPLSGVYLADDLGHWEGHVNFTYVNAKYQFNINQLLLTQEDWEADVGGGIKGALDLVGGLTKQNNLATNLLFWMAWSLQLRVLDTIQVFHLTGHPEVIFKRAYHTGSVGSFAGDCKLKTVSEYSQASDYFTLSFSEASQGLDTNSLCSSIVSPTTLAYDERFQLYASVRFDSRSLAVAAAVNQGIARLDALEKIDDISWAVSIGDAEYRFDEYFDPRYPEMEPVMCVNTTAVTTCLLFVNDLMLAYPLFNHYGANDNTTSHADTEPQMCSCADSTGSSFNCNTFNFLSGFLFYNTGDDRDSNLRGITELVLSYPNQTQLNMDAYLGMFSAAASFTSGTRFDASSFRHLAYDFCQLPGNASVAAMNCSILSINSHDDFYSVSPYYLTLSNGSCTDSVSTPTVELLALQPPDELTEKFFECSNTLPNSLVKSLGVSVGIVQLFLPIVVLLAVGLAHLIASMWGKTSHRQYVPGDRESILDVLALQLLLVRDENMVTEETRQRSKRRRRPTMPPQTTLHAVIAETKAAVLESGGYLDMVAQQNGIHDLRPALGLPEKGKGVKAVDEELGGTFNRVPFGEHLHQPNTLGLAAAASAAGVRRAVGEQCEYKCTGDYKGGLTATSYMVGSSVVTIIPPVHCELPGPVHEHHDHTDGCTIRIRATPVQPGGRRIFPASTITQMLPVAVNAQMHIGQVQYNTRGHIIFTVTVPAPALGNGDASRVLSVQEVAIEQCSLFHMAAMDHDDDEPDNENTPVRVIKRGDYRRAIATAGNTADSDADDDDDGDITVIGSLYKFLNSP